MNIRLPKLLRFTLLVCVATLCTFSNVYAAQVRAWLDRSSMQLGETVTLNVEVTDDATAAQPDFSALQADFNLLGTQSSTAMNIVNGQASSKLIWAVGLEPKRAGSFTIPALSVAGAQTQALPLVVNPGGTSTTSGKAGDDVFLDVSVEPKNPYVQQQVRVTMKLFYAVNLTDGNVEDPHGEGFVARKLGQDAAYTADVDGRRYRVLERHYSLTPEKSGALSLAPIVFRGHAVNPADVNSFFNRGRAVTAQSPAATFDVRPRPAASGTDAWLPAQSLTLTASGVDSAAAARVGEPLTLTLHVQAKGLGFEPLPELKLPKIDGADIYPDKETTLNRDDGVWQLGERERKFAIVPNRAGALTLPALSLQWWDVEHDRAASAELPAMTLNVAAALAGATAANVQNATNAAIVGNAAAPTAAAPSSIALSDVTTTGELRLWRSIAFAALALWILTLVAVGFWWNRQRVKSVRVAEDSVDLVDANARTARKAFNDACAKDDASAAARALLVWAHADGSSVRTLGELARVLDDDVQRAALAELDRARYGGGSINGIDLAAAFRPGLRLASAPKVVATSSLPPLYPFTVVKDANAAR